MPNFIFLILIGINLSLNWYKLETEHFIIHYPEELYDSAKKVAYILEEKTYPNVTRLYKQDLEGKLHIVIVDIWDSGNGFAMEIFNQIVIFTADIYYYPLRGRNPWLEDVLTHEFAHIIALKKARKLSKYIPGFSLNFGFFYSPVIFGGKDKWSIVLGTSVGFLTQMEPSYFTEGIAQLITENLGYDSLDSYRDMTLRTLLYNNKLLTLDEIANFDGKRGFEGELVYNHGFSFLKFISERYGFDKIVSLSEKASNFFQMSYENILSEIIGKNREELQNEWKEWLSERYKKQIEDYNQNPKEGTEIKLRKKGKVYFSLTPKLNPASITNIAVIEDGKLNLYTLKEDIEKIESKNVDSSVNDFSFSSDGKSLVYSKSVPTGLEVSGILPEVYSDIFIYSIADGSKKRITHKERAVEVSFSPNGNTLAIIKTYRDSRNLWIFNIETKQKKQITDFKDGSQIVFPEFSPDGKKIIASYYNKKQQDIVLFNIESGDFQKITDDLYEDRDPSFISDNEIIFSSNRNGIFNIYLKNLETGKEVKLTNVLSAALYPYPTSDLIVYSAFTPDGFKIYKMKIDKTEEVNNEAHNYPKEDNKNKSEDLDKVGILKNERDYLTLTPPYFFPGVGAAINPLIFSGRGAEVLLDSIGFFVDAYLFDRVGRMDMNLSGFAGIRGSTSISGTLGANFPIISSLFSLRYSHLNTSFSIESIYYGSQKLNYSFDILDGGVTPYLKINDEKFSFTPYIGLRSSHYSFYMAEFEKETKYTFRSFYGEPGIFFIYKPLRLGTQLQAKFISTNQSFPSEEAKRAFEGEPTSPYIAFSLEGTLGSGYKHQFDDDGKLISVSAIYLSYGRLFSKVNFVDEFWLFPLGYIIPFSGEEYLSSTALTSLSIQRWTKRIWTFYFSDFSIFAVGQMFGVFEYENRIKTFEDVKNLTELCSSEENKIKCGYAFGLSFSGRAIYELPMVIAFITAFGPNEIPSLRAPFRIYLIAGFSL